MRFLQSQQKKLYHFVSIKLTTNREKLPSHKKLSEIKYFHKIVGHHDPCNSELVNYVLESIKRICCHTPKKKKSFTPQPLHTLYRSLGEDNTNLINLRTMLLCVLSFMGFLKFSEVINLKNSDIVLNKTHMSIFIEKSKTDVYREGSWMHLSKLQSALCPIKLYIETAKVKESEDKFIFRQICRSKQGFKLKDLDKPISYTTVRDILLTNLKNVGLDKIQFGLHSLRSGGATAAANVGINNRLFQKHGREYTGQKTG